MKQKVNTQILIKNYGIILVLLLSFWAVKPLFIPGFFPMHDDTQVARVFEMGKALRDGMFPVRWVPDLGYGYGYPIFNFYAPLAYYFGGLLTVIGFDALVATKIMMIAGVLLSGVFMYLLAKEFWGELGGVVSALFYVYAPYHAVDVYVRGDVAEFWAYAFMPLMFLGIYKVFDPPRRSPSATSEVSSVWRWVIIGALGYAGIILSHNLTAMMVTPFLVIVALLYCYIAYKNKNLSSIFYILYSILLGLLLSAFYWLPALLEMKYTNVLSQIGGGADFRDHFVCLFQLWESNWGFGGSAPGCTDGLSFKIGKLHITAVFFGVIIASIIAIKKKLYHSNDTYHYSANALIITLLILEFMLSVFLTLEISKPVWEAVPLMTFFQYPWRFLLLISFFSSLLSGAVIWFFLVFTSTSKESFDPRLSIKLIRFAPFRLRGASSVNFNTVPYLSGAVLIFLLIFFNTKPFQPQTILLKTSSDYTNATTLKWTTSKISDEYMPKDFYKPQSEDEIVKERLIVDENLATVKHLKATTNIISADLDVLRETSIHVNLAHFPTWKFFIDGEKIEYKTTFRGYDIYAPYGQHRFDIKFEQTGIQKIANSISVAGIAIVVAGIIMSNKKR